jgi:topoisomerase-4 subunit B
LSVKNGGIYLAKANKTTSSYDDSSIQILHGLEAVRKRPGMYIGSTDIHGLNQLVYEIVDNSVDEAMAGYGKEINVTIHKDNSVTVQRLWTWHANRNAQSGIPTIEVILTVLHAGGKFTEKNYQTSGGLHGVGSSVVNALSSYIKVRVVRDGKAYEEEFENGGHPDWYT